MRAEVGRLKVRHLIYCESILAEIDDSEPGNHSACSSVRIHLLLHPPCRLHLGLLYTDWRGEALCAM